MGGRQREKKTDMRERGEGDREGDGREEGEKERERGGVR